VKTVQNYVSRILDKLQVADRTQAALRARDAR
jgi:DNA-binding NarL/FixJ family response regulator